MSIYSITDLELLTGIKSHTIRTWEKRYGIIKPSRTKTNVRNFSERDLRSLLNIVYLKNHGLRISNIAKLTPEEIENRILEIDSKYHSENVSIDKFIKPIVEMDEQKIVHLLNHCMVARGLEETYECVIKSILRKVIVLENTGTFSRVQRNFLVNIIRRCLYVAIENIPVSLETGKKICFLMPTTETIDIRLLFLNYLATKDCHKCYNIGHISESQITEGVLRKVKPEVIVITFFSMKGVCRIRQYLDSIRKQSPDIKILVSGPVLEIKKIPLPSNTYYVDTAEEFKTCLN